MKLFLPLVPSRRSGWARSLLTIAALACASGLSHAGNTWTDASGGNWSVNGNWNGGTAPTFGAGSTLDFSTLAITGAQITTADSGHPTVGTIVIGSTNGTGQWTLAANNWIVMNGGAADAAINQTSTSGGDTISAELVTATNLDLTNASATKVLTLSGPINSDGSHAITISNLGTAAGGTLISGTITDSNGSGDTISVVQNNANGFLELSAANSYVGNTTLTAGSLIVDGTTGNVFGSGTLILNGGTLSSAVTGANLSNAVTLNGTVTIGGTHTLTLSGAISMPASTSNTLNITDTAATSFGALTSTGTLSNLVINSTSGSTATFASLGNQGNLTLNANSSGAIAITAGLTNLGTFTNSGTGSATTTLASIGNNTSTTVTSVTENSLTSALSLSATAGTFFTGGMTIKDGTVALNGNVSGLTGAAGTTVTLGSATGIAGGFANLLVVNNGISPNVTSNLTTAANAVGFVEYWFDLRL